MFQTRLLSGIVLVIIALVFFILGGPALALLLCAISMVAFRELTKVLGVSGEDKKYNAPEIIGLVGTVVYYVLAVTGQEAIWLLACIVGVFMAVMFAYVIRFPKYQIEQIVGNVFAWLYGPLMLSFIYLTRAHEQGKYMVWLILLASWGCDTSAYCVGMLIGKKKIFPVLSPKKSLEGCIGGVVGAALLGALYGQFVVGDAFDGATWTAALICAVGAVMSQVGDLAASAIKRNKGIKDYGKLIPGHGGIMDRFDSVIVTAPMIYFLTVLLLG